MFAREFEEMYKLKYCQTNKSYDMSEVDKMIDLLAIKLNDVEYLISSIEDIEKRESRFESKVRSYPYDVQVVEYARRKMLEELEEDKKRLPDLKERLQSYTTEFDKVHKQAIEVIREKNLKVIALFLGLTRQPYSHGSDRSIDIDQSRTRVINILAEDLSKIHNKQVDIYHDLGRGLDKVLKECNAGELGDNE